MVVAGSFAVGDNHDAGPFGQIERPIERIEQDAPITNESESFQPPAQDTVESGEGQLDQPVTTPASQADDQRILSLFTRIQTLERELSLMQGRIEELEHLYQEERHMNRRRFLDMDRRLREQFGGQLAPEDTLTTEDLDSEVGLYRRGMSFIDAEDYVQASNLFQRIVNEYPNGEKVPDAMYWLAEIHHNVAPKDLERARQYFVQMVTLYSDHARIPEALAKLGMIYHELGNVTRALEYLDRVVAEFPDHDAAQLAATYAQELR